ncbi:MAG: DUF4147 domain-containing protein [Gammaproteobacteria bacterium]|nr:DUF4147 domain-containing protein [Gammaproteobacteria bacterium]MDH5777178.1 DUF4147 domain-containing protein [Gammaproteobacteria bacterium]
MQTDIEHNINRQLLELLQAGLDAVTGRNCVATYLSEYPLDVEKIAVIAIGKAAASMAQGAIDVLQSKIESALIISKSDYHDQQLCALENIHCHDGSHPVPDESSLSAGKALLYYLEQLPAELPILFLISGGTSSLVEVLPDGIGLEDLQRMNQWLLASGLPIDQMNLIRKSVSSIKGGRLTNHLTNNAVLNLIISDVPDNNPANIGSGLLVPDTTAQSLPDGLPDWLLKILNIGQQENVLSSENFTNISTNIIASNQTACVAVENKAKEYGLAATIHPQGLDGDAVEMAQQISTILKNSQGGVHIWGGETTVTLPDSPGRGGRNQHLALALALEIQSAPDVVALVIGTDGCDGNSDDAGALVDGLTVQRGEQLGLSASDYLQEARSGEFFADTGELINTGHTGTNVMDMVIAFKRS